MDLIQTFRLDRNAPASRMAFVGSGGKTTAIFQCARCFNGPVLVTASTHLAVSQIELADHHYFADQISSLSVDSIRGVTLITGPIDGETKRTLGLRDAKLERLLALANEGQFPLLIEADGSRQLPLKAPADHEPPIPKFVDTVVVVAGLSGLGHPLSVEFVHRPKIFASLSGLGNGDLITPIALTQVLTHPLGGLKNIPTSTRRIALLNQADTAELQAQASEIAEALRLSFQAVAVTTLQSPNPIPNPKPQIHAVYEPIAAVILAAGEATRFGAPKQLLDWQGQSLIWHVAQRAIEAGLTPVNVVCGRHIDQIQQAIGDLPVSLIFNPDWEQGQGSSVRAGANAVPAQNGGILFMLADQPQIPVNLIRELIAHHARTLNPIIAPIIDGQRANPVLFDQITFSDLQALTGEKGGRQLFGKYPVQWIPWHDPTSLLDVDTPDDYRRLLELKT